VFVPWREAAYRLDKDMDADHLQRFAGIGRLYGRAGMERLARSSFLVVGLGGVGSWTVEALARSGVGHLAMVDGDAVCVSNTNRQLHAVTGNDGKPKTEAMAERARSIHPKIRTTLHQRSFRGSTRTRCSRISTGW
jgi:tRNA threonylcarbamoyladenosine dehydratase